MTQQNNLTTQPIYPAALNKRMLLGAGVALLVISAFLLAVKNPDPAWGKLWMLRPLIIVPLAGTAGGAFSYLMDRVGNQGGWIKLAAIIFSVIAYIIALWLGTVLGLAGTLWH